MQRVTIALDDEFVAELDRVIAERGYQNRSEAIRDLARAGMRQAAEEATSPAIAWRLSSMSTTTTRASLPSG